MAGLIEKKAYCELILKQADDEVIDGKFTWISTSCRGMVLDMRSNGFHGTVHTGTLPQSSVVPVYNCGDDDLEANSAVSFVTEQQQYSLEDVAAAPVQKYTSGTRWCTVPANVPFRNL